MDHTGSVASPFEPTADEHGSFSASVKTKDGPVVMLIQKPAKPLSTRSKPNVIVRRSDGELEMGQLLYVGKIGGKELAGVHLEIQRKQICRAACLVAVKRSRSILVNAGLCICSLLVYIHVRLWCAAVFIVVQ